MQCCPVCQCLLNNLLGTEAEFIVRGSQSAISACALPEWLLDGFVKCMNKVFGAHLRWELTKIFTQPEVGRNCTQSTGSQRLSVDSLELDSRTTIHENRSVDYKHMAHQK